MEDNKQLVNIGGIIKKAGNSAVAMKALVEEVGNVLKADRPEKEVFLKLFMVGFLYFLDSYFAEIGFKLHSLLDVPSPKVPENAELKEKWEKLKRKETRMTKSSYKKRFRFTWYKDWDVEKKFPQHEFDSEAYDREFDKIESRIAAAERAVENDAIRRRAEIMNARLEEMLSAIFYGFETGEKIQTPVVSYVLQTVNIEHFLLFIKRACSILEVDIKKNNGWNEKSAVLGNFLVSLKKRIQDFSSTTQARLRDSSSLGRLVTLQDIALEAELFVVETSNSIVAQRRQAEFQAELQSVLEGGFKQMTAKLGVIEKGIITMNSQMSGINGRLTDILKVNGEILNGIVQSGRLIGSLSDKLDGISRQISNIGDMMSEMLISQKE